MPGSAVRLLLLQLRLCQKDCFLSKNREETWPAQGFREQAFSFSQDGVWKENLAAQEAAERNLACFPLPACDKGQRRFAADWCCLSFEEFELLLAEERLHPHFALQGVML